jgi:hypothetical protein
VEAECSHLTWRQPGVGQASEMWPYPIVNKRLTGLKRGPSLWTLALRLLHSYPTGLCGFAAALPICDPLERENTLKRLILTTLLAVLVTPCIASAQFLWHPGPPPQKIGADQMANVGLAVAAMVGVAGYLALRKRTTV